MFYTDDLAVFLSLQLLPQERLLWWSRPVVHGVLREVYIWFAATCLIAVTCSVLMYTREGASLFTESFGGLLVVVLCAKCIRKVVVVLGWRERLRYSAYGVTDRRVLLLLSGKTYSLHSFSPEEIGEIRVCEDNGGRGTVFFGTRASRRRLGKGPQARPALVGIEHPSLVALLLCLLRTSQKHQDVSEDVFADASSTAQNFQALLPMVPQLPALPPACIHRTKAEELARQILAIELGQLTVAQTEQAIINFVDAQFTPSVPAIERLLKSENSSLRMCALVALTLDWGIQEYWSTAITFLSDPALECREVAVEALGVLICPMNEVAILTALCEVVSDRWECSALRESAWEIMLAYSGCVALASDVES